MDGFLYKICLSFDEINTARFTVTTWSLLFKQFFHSHVLGMTWLWPNELLCMVGYLLDFLNVSIIYTGSTWSKSSYLPSHTQSVLRHGIIVKFFVSLWTILGNDVIRS